MYTDIFRPTEKDAMLITYRIVCAGILTIIVYLLFKVFSEYLNADSLWKSCLIIIILYLFFLFYNHIFFKYIYLIKSHKEDKKIYMQTYQSY